MLGVQGAAAVGVLAGIAADWLHTAREWPLVQVRRRMQLVASLGELTIPNRLVKARSVCLLMDSSAVRCISSWLASTASHCRSVCKMLTAQLCLMVSELLICIPVNRK